VKERDGNSTSRILCLWGLERVRGKDEESRVRSKENLEMVSCRCSLYLGRAGRLLCRGGGLEEAVSLAGQACERKPQTVGILKCFVF